MIANDYLMRMILNMTRALGTLMKLKEQKRYEEIVTCTGEEFKRLLGMHPDTLDWFDHLELMRLLSGGNVPDPDACLPFALLLKEDGAAQAALGSEETGVVRLVKSLDILLELPYHDLADVQQQTVDKEVQELMELLGGYALGSGTSLRLFGYYRAIAKYDKAEDMLFAAGEALAAADTDAGTVAGTDSGTVAGMDAGTDARKDGVREAQFAKLREAWMQAGLQFYTELETLEETELRKGGLTAAEVREGARDFARLIQYTTG